jgi:thioredoxin-related protein
VCRSQVDELKAIYEKYSGRGVQFLNAMIPETDEFGMKLLNEDSVLVYVQETKTPFPVYMDSNDGLADSYAVPSVPFLAFITGEGKLMLTRPFTYKDDVAKILDALISGREIDTSGMPTASG